MGCDPADLACTAGHEPVEVRASTVRPARRESVELHAVDGQTLVGEAERHDVEAAAAWAAAQAPPHADLTGVDGAEPLWAGERFVRRVLDEIASTVLGEPVELPSTWSGPMAKSA